MDDISESYLRITRRGLLEAGTAAVGLVGFAPEVLAAAKDSASAERMAVTLEVNGTSHRLNLDPRTTLLDALREHLALT